MKKELVEEALTNIDDKYIEEALNYKKKKVVKFPDHSSRLIKAATVTLAVLVVGSASVYAGSSVFRKVVFTDHSMSMAVSNNVTEDSELDDEYVDDADISWDDIQDMEPVQGDDSVKWVSKYDQLYGDCVTTFYQYESYEDAAADAGMDLWFDPLPGEVTNVEYVYSLDSGYADRFITIDGEYKGYDYFIEENRASGELNDDFVHKVTLENVQNERTYTNVKGQTFTLADEIADNDGYDENGNLGKVQRVKTTTLILYGNHWGDITFWDMPDKYIHRILDQITLENSRN